MYRGANRFVVVGKGKQAAVLEAAKRQSAPIDLHGWLPAEERDSTYARARALLLPSIWYENAPLVAFEALAWGTPLLCSDTGALPETLHGGLCGRPIRPTPEGILEGIDRFEAEDGPSRQRGSARTAYETFHSPPKYLEQYHRLIEAMWDRRGTPPSRELSDFPAIPAEPFGSRTAPAPSRVAGDAR
jgi:glycosyltransferase involved in cell wall biosynthesis